MPLQLLVEIQFLVQSHLPVVVQVVIITQVDLMVDLAEVVEEQTVILVLTDQVAQVTHLQ